MSKRIDNVTVIHGFGVTPEKMWFPWLHEKLEERGLAVRIPRLPDPLRPNYKKWMGALAPIARTWSPTTLVVAHSLGGAFAVRLLETEVKKRIAGVVLVSPLFTSTIPVEPLVRFFSRPIDWPRIGAMSGGFSVLQATDDPLVPADHAFRYAEALGAELTLIKKGGHLTKKTCPPLLKIIDGLLTR